MTPPPNTLGAVRPSDRRTRWTTLVLLFAMALLSLVLWIGVPLAWMWLASLVTADSRTWYLAIIVAIPVTMVGVGWVLYRVNRVYVRVSGEPARPEPVRWLESHSADRSSRPPRRAIEVIMTCSVALAFVLFLFWFFFLAGSPLPPPG